MAQVIPADWLSADFLHEGEKETIGWLEEALPPEYYIYAGLRWAAAHVHGDAYFGEVDLAIIGPSAKLVLIEQKNGGLSVSNGRLVKRYGTKEKVVNIQIRRSVEAFKAQWFEQGHETSLMVDYLVLLPDYRVHDVNAVELQADRIVDRERLPQLPELLQQLLAGRPLPERFEALRAFLDGTLGISQDLDMASLRMDQRLSARGDHLSEVVRRLTFSPWRLRVNGAAGSGKTVLAQSLFRDARKAEQKALYLCFNRPLADGVARALGAQNLAMTVDRLTEVYPLEDPFDPRAGSEAFEARRTMIQAAPVHKDWQFDLVVVDEGQDFSLSQRQLAERLVAEGGRFIWLEDDRQRLYQREDAVAPPCTVTLDLRENYRTAKSIVRYMNVLLQLSPEDIPAAAIEGAPPEFRVVAGRDELLDAVVQQVRALLDEGYQLAEIAVLSYHGHASSWLLGLDRIGIWPTIRFTGDYDVAGNQQYSEGKLRVESVHRFKGLQAEAVILVEVDFDSLGEQARSRLYVGMTRARQSLTVLLEEKAGSAIREALGA